MLRFASLMIGLGFTAVIGFVAYLTVFDTPYRSELACSRALNSCVIQQLMVGHNRPSWSVPLSTLTAAQVRIFPARRGAPRISVYLIANTQSYYFADYARRSHAEADAARIRRYFSSPDENLSVVQDDRITFYFIGFGFAVLLALLIVLWRVLLRVAPEPASRPAVDTQPAAS